MIPMFIESLQLLHVTFALLIGIISVMIGIFKVILWRDEIGNLSDARNQVKDGLRLYVFGGLSLIFGLYLIIPTALWSIVWVNIIMIKAAKKIQ